MDCNVTITGNVGSTVSFKSGESDGRKWARAEFRVASTRRMRRADGSWGDAGTTWITVQAWAALAEGVRASIDKGDPIIVAGRLRTDEWSDNNGEVRSRLTMVADAVGHDLSRGRARFVRNVAIPEPSRFDEPESQPEQASSDADAPEPPAVDFDALADELDADLYVAEPA